MAKKNKKQKQIYCPMCGAPAKLVTAREMFKERAIDPDRKIWVCSRYEQGCDTYVYAEKRTDRPLGKMEGPYVRSLRIKAHRMIDSVVSAGIMSKRDVYNYLSDAMGYRAGQFHVARCGEYGCNETIRLMGDILHTARGTDQ